MRPLRALAYVLLLGLAARGAAQAAGYDSLVEQGLFYLSRGATYGPEAVRSLEGARATDPTRAAGDARWKGALARAYALTSRYTEAFWLLEDLEGAGSARPEDDALRTRLVSESGLGRIRLVSAVPLTEITVSLEVAEGARLDVTSRRALERLNELLGRGVSVGPRGVDVLGPEGRFRLSCAGASLYAPREPVPVEVWAGDEATLRLVPLHPKPSAWRIEVRSRSIALSWPPLEGEDASFRLYRGDGAEPVYLGAEPAFVDEGLPVGTGMAYRLEAVGSAGDLLAASWVEARTLPPVRQVAAEASLESDLRVRLSWSLGPGAVDRVRVVRTGPGGEAVLAERVSPGSQARGQVEDGPFKPAGEARSVRYRVEAWVEGEDVAAAFGEAEAEIPPLVQRVTDVAESLDRGSVVVVWDTLPREGVAEGFAVFRQRGPGLEGELVGRVRDPFAREFYYPVERPLEEASGWRHFVIPYVGERYLLDPEWVRARGTVPADRFERRRRQGEGLPDVGLAWDPYPGATAYSVRVGESEVLVRNPYLEVDGLQTPLMGTRRQIEVSALDEQGRKILLLRMEVDYEHYPRALRREEKP